MTAMDSVESEQHLLASVMVSPEAADLVLGMLRPSAFIRESHGLIWEAASSLWQQGEEVNQITVAYQLAHQNRLDSVGGQTYLATIIRDCPLAEAAEWYAGEVRRASYLRWLMKLGHHLMSTAERGEADPDTLAEEVAAKLLRGTEGRTEVKSLADLGGPLLEELDRWAANPRFLRGPSTGWRSLDQTLSGLALGGITLVLADTGVGKSYLVANLARNVARSGEPVFLLSTEMSDNQSAWRLLWLEAGHNDLAARNRGTVLEEELEAAHGALSALSGLPLHIAYGPTPLARLTGLLRRLRPTVAVIDHIDDISVPGEKGAERVLTVMSTLKALALEQQMHIVIVSHIDRASARDGNITLHSGIWGGEKEKRSDNGLIITPLTWDEQSQRWVRADREEAAADRQRGALILRVDVAKSRFGHEGTLKLRQDWQRGGRLADFQS